MMSKQEKDTSLKLGKRLKSLFPLPFFFAFAFDLVYGFFYYRSYDAVSFYDTSSYFVAASKLLDGKVDLLRTPLYPLFLHFCEKAGKDNVNRFCVNIQIVIFCISIYFFYKLLELFTSNKPMLMLGTVFYGCMSAIINYNTFMLTESLAVSGTVLFCYLLVLYTRNRNNILLAACIVFALLLAMLRPSFVFLLVVVAVAVAILIVRLLKKEKSKLWYVPVIAFVLSMAFLFGYMQKNKKDNGYFGLSYVSDMNRFYDVVQADIWHDSLDRAIVDEIQKHLDENAGVLGAAIKTEETFREKENGPDRIIKFNNEVISTHKTDYVNYLVKKVILMGNTKMQYNLTNDSYFLKEDADRNMFWPGDLLDFNVNFSYMICLVSVFAVFAVIIKRKKLLEGELLLILVMAGQIGINILSGPAEFHRLNVICYPLALILLFAGAGIALDHVLSKKTEEKTQEKK